jgi:gluconokinase
MTASTASPAAPAARAIVVMGVAGCGKTSVGEALALALGWPFIEGDAHHAPASIAKMQAGQPLTDEDRWGWLDRLGALLAGQSPVVLSCSALKRAYRDRLRGACPSLAFVFLEIDKPLALTRVAARAAGHIFPASLVDSQFATLEPPTGEPGVVTVPAALPVAEQVRQALAALAPDAPDTSKASETSMAPPAPQDNQETAP